MVDWKAISDRAKPAAKTALAMVLAYGIAINLVEVTWKAHLGLLRPDPKGYQDFMANFSMATGLTTMAMMLFVSNNVIRTFPGMEGMEIKYARCLAP